MDDPEMKKLSLTSFLLSTSMLLTTSLHAAVSEPVTLVENIKKVFPGSHISSAYAIRSTDNALLKIEQNNIVNTGIVSNDLIKVLSSSFSSFAAFTSSGEVLTHTDSLNGPTIISDIIDLQAMQGGFVALRSNGTIVTWSEQVPPYQCQSHLNNVKKVTSSPQAYGVVALHGDGTISAWSYDICSGFSIKDVNAIDVAVGIYGFTVLDSEGVAYTYPYDTQHLMSQVSSVDRLVSGNNYGLSISSEYIDCGGASANINGKGSLKVVTAFGTGMMMLQMSDGSVSQAHCYGNAINEQSQATIKTLTNIKSIISNYSGFAAIDTAGDLFTWGGYSNEYDDNLLDISRHNIASVTPMLNSFAALKYDGTVIAWGDQMNIENGSQRQLRNITGIYPSAGQFLALSKGGTLYAFD